MGEEKITISENGVPKTITKIELAVKAMFVKACNGDHKSIALIMDNQPPAEKKEPTLTEGFSWTEEHEELLKLARDESNPII